MYDNTVISTKKLFLGNIKYLFNKGKGPHDIQNIHRKIPTTVETSITQKEANPLNHNFLSPLTNLPN